MNHNDPKDLDVQAWANSVVPNQTAPEQSDRGLHRLPLYLHLLDGLLNH